MRNSTLIPNGVWSSRNGLYIASLMHRWITAVGGCATRSPYRIQTMWSVTSGFITSFGAQISLTP